MPRRRSETVIALLDWNTAITASGAALRKRRPDVVARTALQHVERVVSDHLHASADGAWFRVRLRFYTGWHSGKTRTDHYLSVTRMRETYAGRVRTYHDGGVAFLGGADGIQLGARLSHVSRTRLARGQDVHLLDTLRHRDGRMAEKMVDTALVADLLGLAFRREADRYVVVSDDDDMWPGVLGAEAAGARISMLSRPGMRSRFMAHAADLVSTY